MKNFLTCSVFILVGIFIAVPANAKSVFDNTPFDPDTYKEPAKKVGGFIKNPVKTTKEETKRWKEDVSDFFHLGGQGCIAKANDVMGRYKSNRGLTPLEKKYLEPWFGKDINLERVTVFWGASLNKDGPGGLWVGSAAQTFGYRIFFSEQHNPGTTKQLIDLAHELVHTVQHEKLGGLKEFCQSYMNGYTNAGSYEYNPMELEAFKLEFNFAKWLRENVIPAEGTTWSTYYNNTANDHRSGNQQVDLPDFILLERPMEKQDSYTVGQQIYHDQRAINGGRITIESDDYFIKKIKEENRLSKEREQEKINERNRALSLVNDEYNRIDTQRSIDAPVVTPQLEDAIKKFENFLKNN